jgi:hypothetical protein
VPNRYELKTTAGALAVSRHWEKDLLGIVRPPMGGGGSRAGLPGESTAGRVSLKWSARSQRSMRFLFSALPWELLGTRPAMITLTYPGDWQLYVPNSEVLRHHREAFKERWRKRFGPPIGVWIVEFQKRGAPHLHMYLGLPDAVSEADYRQLQERTMRRKRREFDVGPFRARWQTPPVSGEFGEWLRRAWWEVVGSGLPAHEKRGVDVAVAFFSEQAESEANRTKVGDYFWRESGKWKQKRPPEDFGSLKFYGHWGRKEGFNPVVSAARINEMAFYEMRRMLLRLRVAKLREQAKQTGRRVDFKSGRPRGRDGMTVFDVDGRRLGPILLACAERNAFDKVATRAERVTHYGRGPSWRAASEMVLSEDNEPEPDWQCEPEDIEVDPDAEAEAYWARREEEEAAILAAIDAEIDRADRIDAVRAANGLPSQRRRKRLRVVVPKGSGREG